MKEPINALHRKYDSLPEFPRFMTFMLMLFVFAVGLCLPMHIWISVILMAPMLWFTITRLMYFKKFKQ